MRKKTGKRRVAALMAAGMLAVLPAMSAAAEEPVKITSIDVSNTHLTLPTILRE